MTGSTAGGGSVGLKLSGTPSSEPENFVVSSVTWPLKVKDAACTAIVRPSWSTVRSPFLRLRPDMVNLSTRSGPLAVCTVATPSKCRPVKVAESAVIVAGSAAVTRPAARAFRFFWAFPRAVLAPGPGDGPSLPDGEGPGLGGPRLGRIGGRLGSGSGMMPAGPWDAVSRT